jgi:hypothetical protein
MPPREFQTPRAKREELKTYRELTLKRDLKSIRARRRLEAGGLHRVLGDGSTGQPYLAVETARYRAVRLEIQRQLLVEARDSGLHLPVDELLRQLHARIESMCYEKLATEKGDEMLGHVPVGSLGRALTAEERKQFAAAAPAAPPAKNQRTRNALNQVLGQIEQRQTHNPARYQTIWAQLVGGDAAQQSFLDNIDAATQTAWFRCFNSVLSADLQRRKGLAQKLAKALGLPIRQLRAKF